MAASRVHSIPATIAHVYTLAANMREGDRAEMEAAGLDAKVALRKSFRAALIRETIFVDGEIAAMWGMGGDALSDIGTPWLLTTPAAERVPVSFLRVAKKNVATMLRLKPILVNYVDARYARACRFVEALGFVLEPPAPFGPKGALFRRFELRREWATKPSR
jgi:hypothetical protein